MNGFVNMQMFLNWGWYSDANTFRVFFHLLANAEQEGCVMWGIELERGQLITSRKDLAKATGISEQNVRTALTHLQSTNELTIKSTNKHSIVTICNFDSWQVDKSAANQQSNQQSNQQLTNNPKINKVNNNINNNINKKKKKDINTIVLMPYEKEKIGDKSPLSAEPTPGTKVRKDDIDFKAFLQFFNETISGCSIPPIRFLSEQRKAMLRARMREHGKQALAQAVHNAANSSFLNGAGDKAFVASFDWIFRPNNFPKVLEGNYNDITTSNNGKDKQLRRTVYQQQQLDNIKAAEQDVLESIAKTIGRTTTVPKELPDGW